MTHAPQPAQHLLGRHRLVLGRGASRQNYVAAAEVDDRPRLARLGQGLERARGEVLLDRGALEMNGRHAHAHERDHAPQPAPPIASHRLNWLPRIRLWCYSTLVPAARGLGGPSPTQPDHRGRFTGRFPRALPDPHAYSGAAASPRKPTASSSGLGRGPTIGKRGGHSKRSPPGTAVRVRPAIAVAVLLCTHNTAQS